MTFKYDAMKAAATDKMVSDLLVDMRLHPPIDASVQERAFHQAAIDKMQEALVTVRAIATVADPDAMKRIVRERDIREAAAWSAHGRQSQQRINSVVESITK